MMTRQILRLSCYERGNSTIEMAIMLPFIVLLVLGISDVAMAYSARLKLEQIAQRSIEMVTAAGQVGTDYDHIEEEAMAVANLPDSQVTVDNWLECNGTRNASFTGVCPSGQTTARYVSLDLVDYFDPVFDSSAFISGSDYVYGRGFRHIANAQVRVQ